MFSKCNCQGCMQKVIKLLRKVEGANINIFKFLNCIFWKGETSFYITPISYVIIVIITNQAIVKISESSWLLTFKENVNWTKTQTSIIYIYTSSKKKKKKKSIIYIYIYIYSVRTKSKYNVHSILWVEASTGTSMAILNIIFFYYYYFSDDVIFYFQHCHLEGQEFWIWTPVVFASEHWAGGD